MMPGASLIVRAFTTLALIAVAMFGSASLVDGQTPTPGPGGQLPDLAIGHTASPDPASLGGTLTFNITVRNQGSSPAQSVSLRGSIPSGTTFGSAGGGCTLEQAAVRCRSGALAPGAQALFSYSVVVNTATGTVQNLVEVDTEGAIAELDETNNLSVSSTIVQVPTGTATITTTPTFGPSLTPTITPTATLTPAPTPPMSGAPGGPTGPGAPANVSGSPAEPPLPQPTAEPMGAGPAPSSPDAGTPPGPAAPPVVPVPAPISAGLVVIAPTTAYSVTMDELWTAAPGERYVVVRVEDGWALSIWEGDTPAWSVWILLDERVQVVQSMGTERAPHPSGRWSPAGISTPLLAPRPDAR